MNDSKRPAKFFRRGYAAPALLAATAFLALASVVGIAIFPMDTKPLAEIFITPDEKIAVIDEIFTIAIVVDASVPVNVFAGQLQFNPQILYIQSIDYNTSIADLWTEEPWYSNGDGTLSFAGGTTQKGGFTGTDTLIEVTFRTIREGSGVIALQEPRILLYDGLGTDVPLTDPVEVLLTVKNSDTQKQPVPTPKNTSFIVAETLPVTDLNNDGKQSIADVSIFMMNIASSEGRFDFNLDGKVNLKDLNILLSAE